MNNTTSNYQNAIRLLFLLVNGASVHNDESDNKIKGIFRGKARLFALDFWVRYPDYFANELLIKYEETKDVKYIQLAESIFEKEEPDLRRIPMIRFLFGAYERLDDTLSILVSKGLIKQSGNKKNDKIQEYHFLIFEKAQEIVINGPKEFSALKWYEQRTKLICEIANDRKGRELKERQYEQIEYAQTKLGGTIPSIKDELIDKIEEIRKTLTINK